MEHHWLAGWEDGRSDTAWAAMEFEAEVASGKVDCQSWGMYAAWPCMDESMSCASSFGFGVEPACVFPFGTTHEQFKDLCLSESEPAYIAPSDTVAAAAIMSPGFAHGCGSHFQGRQNLRCANGAKPIIGGVGLSHRQRRTRTVQVLIASHLKNLEDEDASRIIHVRRVHKLGFNSSELLRQYCSQFGPVKRVAVSNAHEKEDSVPSWVRLRPSGIAFVVMEQRESAEALFAQGEAHEVCGCEILMRRFQARTEHQRLTELSTAPTLDGDKGSDIMEGLVVADCEKEYPESEVSMSTATTFVASTHNSSEAESLHEEEADADLA